MSTLKVHQIAKELGIDSKTIVAKCKAEDVPNIKDHLSVVSVGLAVTIREWFSSGEMKTAIEKSAHIDIKKIKKRSPAAAKLREQDTKVSAAGAETSSPAPPPAGAAPPAAKTTTARPRSKISRPKRIKQEVLQQTDRDIPAAVVAEAAPPAADSSATVVEVPVAPSPVPAKSQPSPHPPAEVPIKPIRPTGPLAPRGVPNVVPRPVVTPMGPRNVPAPAQLQGPKVVRVETPDIIAPPRPRSRPAPMAIGTGAPAMGRIDRGGAVPPGPAPTRQRSGLRQAGEPVEDEEGRSPRRKAHSTRRGAGRSADAGIELIREWREADLLDRAERLASATGGMLRERRREISKSQQRRQQPHVPATRPSVIEITPPVSLRQLSELMGVKTGELLKKLMNQGVMATVNQTLDAKTAQMLAIDFGVELTIKARESLYAALEREFRQREETSPKVPRPPVVTVLGHVDHGKTSLLDKIRSANVAAGEAGGITQHIGAYTVAITGSDSMIKRVTFLDTPGHQAFTAMRARGANMTDVVVLVVAADDGVMPQTIESINHAKAANVPIVVALNKIDKPDANLNRVLGQLAEHGLNPTEWGGDVEVVRTSAVTGQGVRELIEYLDYVATLRDLKSSPELPARGTVIEAFMDSLRGVVARVMVCSGTLRIGDPIVCGPASGRVRLLLDDKGVSIRQAGPATPVEVIGLDNVPVGGDPLFVVDDLARSKNIAEERARADRESEIAQRSKVTLENLYDTIKKGQIKELNMILKADVQGSVDVLRNTMTEALSEEVQVKLLHSAVGGVTESDVLLAEASNAIIVGFCVAPDEAARKLAEQRGVEIRLYRIIYEITDDIRKALSGMLAPEKQEQILGHAEVRQVIRISRVGNVAGCLVSDGVLQRNNKFRLIRDGSIVNDNLSLESLKRFKEDVRDVRGGLECGLKIAGHDDIKVGDRLEAYKTVDVARTL